MFIKCPEAKSTLKYLYNYFQNKISDFKLSGQGCFTAYPSVVDRTDNIGGSQSVTIVKCIDACRSESYTYALLRVSLK